MQAHTLPTAIPALSAAAFTAAGSMCDGSSIGISTVSKPHFLNVAKSLVLSVVNGETKRKELMPNLMMGNVEVKNRAQTRARAGHAQGFCSGRVSVSSGDGPHARRGIVFRRVVDDQHPVATSAIVGRTKLRV